ncbi:Uncharacterised protein [Mycobacterium tuberculosis]|nr:Uncharacterised protein [Mycobacterium tuberculosis]CKP22851.1 Uncharacterised protein [Mycobacterium tuberculosis]CKS32794.1 Uncharacterised protein [Mycobacterium tuberculosis]CKT37111.1 Uncharacterised protein [Mycobacterium tuberculosis]CNV55548.1 Uncharacterised protein [Mycobacterium tuberculosis]
MRSDVSGVRNSCPASVTSLACRSRDSASARSIKLNASVSLANSSLPKTGMGRRSSVRATRSAASVRRPTGLSPARVTIPPATAATATPIPPTINSTQRSLFMTASVGLRLLEISSELPLVRRMASTRWSAVVRRDMNNSPRITAFSAAPTGSVWPGC